MKTELFIKVTFFFIKNIFHINKYITKNEKLVKTGSMVDGGPDIIIITRYKI